MIKLKDLLNEYTMNSFQMDKIESNKRLERTPASKMMPKSVRTIQESEKRISNYVGKKVFVNSSAFYVKRKGRKEDKIFNLFSSTYWVGIQEFYTNDEKINVSKISIADLTGKELNTPVKNILAEAYVATDVVMGEIKSEFEIIKKIS